MEQVIRRMLQFPTAARRPARATHGTRVTPLTISSRLAAVGIGEVWRDSLAALGRHGLPVLLAVVGCASPALITALASSLLHPAIAPYRQAACRIDTPTLSLLFILSADALRLLSILCSTVTLQAVIQATHSVGWLSVVFVQSVITWRALYDGSVHIVPPRRLCGILGALVLGAAIYQLLIGVGQGSAAILLEGLPFEPDRLTLCGVDINGLKYMLRIAVMHLPGGWLNVPLLESLSRVHLTEAQAACAANAVALGISVTGCARRAGSGIDGAAWLTGLGGCAWLCAVELLLRFRVAAALCSGGVVRPIVTSTRLTLTHIGVVSRHIACLCLAIYFANGLLVVLPALLTKEMLIPSLVEVSGNTSITPLLTLVIDAGTALASAFFTMFSTVYDTRLYAALADPSAALAQRRPRWKEAQPVPIPFSPPPKSDVPEPREISWSYISYS